jgi:uncharacterized RmlC-like cupin family protein
MPEVKTIVKVRPDQATATLQRLPYFVGVSGERSGATGLSMNLVVVPPGAASVPHCHLGFEAAIYQLEGRVRTLWGPGLAESVDTEAGDFLFIPPECRTRRSTCRPPSARSRWWHATLPASRRAWCRTSRRANRPPKGRLSATCCAGTARRPRTAHG